MGANPDASAATDARIWSYSFGPIATRTAVRAGPTARSTAGRSASSSSWRVRSLRTPVISSLPMFCRVITRSATICEYSWVTSAWRRISSPWCHGNHFRGRIGSKIIVMPR